MSYGQDIWCDTLLRPGRTANGVMLLAQALLHRLITARGALQGISDDAEELNYGYAVSDLLGGNPELAAIAAPSLVRAELKKDDRVSDVAVDLTRAELPDGSEQFTLLVHVVPHEPLQTFTLTLSITDVGLETFGVAA